MVQPAKGHDLDLSYEEEEDPACMEEDFVPPRLSTARVGLVLPSTISVPQAEQHYWEPSLD